MHHQELAAQQQIMMIQQWMINVVMMNMIGNIPKIKPERKMIMMMEMMENVGSS